jgi:hypothetical protein
VTLRAQEEYNALRATIRQRGTARVWVFIAGYVAWAAIALVAAAMALPPVVALLPLVVLAATFEGVLALHVAVERIGRYLLVFHDDEWERAAGSFGRPRGAIGVDALFAVPFGTATVLNLMPLMVTTPTAQELAAAGIAHAAFIVRVLVARAAAARQRAIDTERFQQLKSGR